ncbi:hypothetical protein [Lishizhenia sp.]|uniref:hypothetical protein n=1 Tax=Lishizhenia sp. TaxID=2497594 RepID=UPI00299F0FC3|nr:hypothetical protein [Lishizhenia sp.]MDX1446964.1 hypothetical protein [Lishizhenia sp.]
MNKAFKKIETIQNQVKDSVNDLLVENGYSLNKEEKFGDSQALLLQWTNDDSNHSFQLIWDIREQWFDLGEFNRTNNLNYAERSEIDLFPYSVFGVLFRDRYNKNYTKKIEFKIKEKLSSTKPKLH